MPCKHSVAATGAVAMRGDGVGRGVALTDFAPLVDASGEGWLVVGIGVV